MVKPQTDENVLFFGRADFGDFSDFFGSLNADMRGWGILIGYTYTILSEDPFWGF